MLRDAGLTASGGRDLRAPKATPSRALGAQAYHSSCRPSPAVWGDSARMRLCFPSDKEGPGGSEVRQFRLVARKHHPAHVMEANLGRDSLGTPRTEAGSPVESEPRGRGRGGQGQCQLSPVGKALPASGLPGPPAAITRVLSQQPGPGARLCPRTGALGMERAGAARAGPGWTVAVCASPREDALIRAVPRMLTQRSPRTFWSIGISTSAPKRHQAFPASRLRLGCEPKSHGTLQPNSTSSSELDPTETEDATPLTQGPKCLCGKVLEDKDQPPAGRAQALAGLDG
ncbi:hypothetical protein E2I00_015797 [Balaenoptera physalus]|uniref:Uncharacterized protein n=1 Tax=Balaenoptera physalus TaxID=9770 RepID=A0A643CI71_BALPH|nr:hypothetical protein E2I00_015797 [Balaenoptera physalus]